MPLDPLKIHRDRQTRLYCTDWIKKSELQFWVASQSSPGSATSITCSLMPVVHRILRPACAETSSALVIGYLVQDSPWGRAAPWGVRVSGWTLCAARHPSCTWRTCPWTRSPRTSWWPSYRSTRSCRRSFSALWTHSESSLPACP